MNKEVQQYIQKKLQEKYEAIREEVEMELLRWGTVVFDEDGNVVPFDGRNLGL